MGGIKKWRTSGSEGGVTISGLGGVCGRYGRETRGGRGSALVAWAESLQVD